MFSRLINYLRSVSPQGYVNALIAGIGLAANIISLLLFFGAMSTPVTGSNFYVNSREFLAWILVAIVYSVGLINAVIRRRWRRLYGISGTDHSILNFFLWLMAASTFYSDTTKREELRIRNFKRDFSLLYVVMYPITFLYSRAVAATANATGITHSPWGDVIATAFIAIPVAWFMMIVTSMFDYSMSIFAGDQIPQEQDL